MNIEERELLLKLQTSKKNKLSIRIGNVALDQIIKDIKPKDITTMNELAYSTAKAITKRSGMKKKNRNRTSQKQPAWKRKIQKEIEAFRGELSLKEDLSKRINVKAREGGKVKRKYKLQNENDITTAKEIIKQKVKVKAQRSRRFEKRTKFYRQNKIFKTDAKKFYREMGKEPIKIKELPSIKDVEKFWKKSWCNEKEHNEEAE